MSYRVEYNPEKNKIYPITATKKTKWLHIVLTTMVALFILQKLDINQKGKYLLLPGDPEITSSAFSAMVENIRGGDRIGDAVTAFCLEIIQNG